MNAITVSGWWRIGIVLAAAGGIYIGTLSASTSTYKGSQIVGLLKANTWTPAECDPVTVARTINMSTPNKHQPTAKSDDALDQYLAEQDQIEEAVRDPKSAPSEIVNNYVYQVDVTCKPAHWLFESVMSGAAAAGGVALICFIVGWVLSGFRRA